MKKDTVFEGSYDQYNLWTTDATALPGQYILTLDTPEGTLAEINDTVSSQVAEATDEENVFTLEVNKESQGNLSRVFGAFRLVEAPVEIETHPLGIEVRDLNGRRTTDVTIFVQNEDLVVFSGSYNQYAQWMTDEELPVGEYTITLQTPDNTYAVPQDTTQQHAVPTDRQNVFTIAINEENRGNLSRVFAAFQLVETEYRLGVEVRGLDGRRTNAVGVLVTNGDNEVFEGSYNEYLQWVTEEDLPAGEYIITLTTPEGTVAEMNDIASNYAVPTDEENIFTIQLSEANLGHSSTIYGAFRLIEVVTEPVETYEDITTTAPIAYETETRNNPNLPRGERRVVQVGVEGTRSVTERVYYEDGVEVRREIIDESTTLAIKEIIEVGTKTNLGSIVKKVVNVVVKVVKSIFSWFF